jgi:hypothetical protein
MNSKNSILVDGFLGLARLQDLNSGKNLGVNRLRSELIGGYDIVHTGNISKGQAE